MPPSAQRQEAQRAPREKVGVSSDGAQRTATRLGCRQRADTRLLPASECTGPGRVAPASSEQGVRRVKPGKTRNFFLSFFFTAAGCGVPVVDHT